ncbi:sigma-70 family RNA polymerase sigma factor [Sinobaca sp. H24]|uniref:sigma-70 family RNA polymerase sigma factor n=1 Tax=Sinobaca sp. H24 TaxID=2923376 RepID=UPI00207AC955|nr:sigma-70 family RNA polymerase sigma factor [Sinobaca sp. H24]
MDETEERIKRAIKGDDEALAAVLLEQYDFVYHYLLKLTMHPAVAEDMTQETMIRAIERIKQYNPKKAKVSTWLIQIGTNLWIDEKKKRKELNNSQISINSNGSSVTSHPMTG